MKETDLRVDNLVFWNSKAYQVDSICNSGVMSLSTMSGSITQCEHKDLSPIPITEQWLTLLKLEYTGSHQGIMMYKVNENITLGMFGGVCCFFFNDIRMCTKKYVHEVQNLCIDLKEIG